MASFLQVRRRYRQPHWSMRQRFMSREQTGGEKSKTLKSGKRLERIRDVKMKMGTGACLRVLAVENQSLTDYTMPFRCMQYDTMEYGKQAEEIRRKNDTEQNYNKEAERICRFRKSDRLLPVYTVCLYHGEEPWDGPRTLRDMMDFEQGDELSEQFIDYPLRLYCVNEIQDFTIFHTEVRLLFQILQCRKDKKELKRILENNPEFRNMDVETLEVVAVTLNASKIWEERDKYMNGNDEREGYDMCQALREWAEEERSIGIQLGIQQGIKSLIEACKSLGASWDVAMGLLVEKFALVKEEAERYMELYW